DRPCIPGPAARCTARAINRHFTGSLASPNREHSLMESMDAFLRALKLYLVIGLAASALNAVAFHRPPGDSQVERVTALAQDVVLWPRFLVELAGAVDGRLSSLPPEDQPFLYSLLRGSIDQP